MSGGGPGSLDTPLVGKQTSILEVSNGTFPFT